MSVVAYNKQQIIERVKKHLNDGFPHQDFSISDNEILLYIDQAIPFVLKGEMFENAKITGIFETPEAYLATYEVTPLTKNAPTNEYVGSLPQAPLGLPTGYNITDAWVSADGFGRGQSVFITSSKRNPYRHFLPKPSGLFGRVEGDQIYLQSYNGTPLIGINLYVQMPISRTDSLTAPLNMPDSAIEPIFTKTVQLILQRYQIPQDIVKDGLPAGNKTS